MEHGYRLEIVIALAAEAAATSCSVLSSSAPRGAAGDYDTARGHPEPRLRGHRAQRLGGLAMPRLFMVTVPGLEVKVRLAPMHDRLLDEFPNVTDVLATTIPETVLIVYERPRRRRRVARGDEATHVPASPAGAPASRGGNAASVPVRVRWPREAGRPLDRSICCSKIQTERNPV